MILDRPLYLWNKDNKRHLYLEVDYGWVHIYACRFAINRPADAEAGKANMFSKNPKRIIAWLSKAWTSYEQQSLLIFYKETLVVVPLTQLYLWLPSVHVKPILKGTKRAKRD